jgi:histidine triad (HIT) family protein
MMNTQEAPESTACLFCDIVAGQIPAQIVYQDECCTAFRDISPKAPTHILVIPNTHVASHADVKQPQVFMDVMKTAQEVVKQLELTDYRLVINNGVGAGQSVFHLHLHILAGRAFTWPPG